MNRRNAGVMNFALPLLGGGERTHNLTHGEIAMNRRNTFVMGLALTLFALFLSGPPAAPAQQPPEFATAVELPNPDPAFSDELGTAVAGVANLILVGAPGDGAGSVSLFEGNGNLLRTISNPVPDPFQTDQFGAAVAGMGSNLLVGAPFDDTEAADAGSVYLFDELGNPPLIINHTGSGDRFGSAVATLGNKILVGAPYNDGVATNSGAVYLYDDQGTLLLTIGNPEPDANDHFGAAVAALDNNILVAAPENDAGADDAGSVYLFDQQGNHLLTINNPDPGPFPDDFFGKAIAGMGSKIVVGAPNDDGLDTNAGSVYVFDESGTPLLTIENPAPGSGAGFGGSLAGVGTNFLVGAPGKDVAPDTDVGGAYLFDGETGDLLFTFANPEPEANDRFGAAVAAVGNSVVIGAPKDDSGASFSGTAYFFEELVAGASICLTMEASATTVSVGEEVTYTYTVTNDGTVELNTVTVTDEQCAPVYASGDEDPYWILDPGESWIFKCSRTFDAPGAYTSTAVGRGSDPQGNEVTYPADPEEIAQITVTVPSPIGDITGIEAAVGLTGGGEFGDVTLSLDTSYQLPQTCSDGAVAEWDDATEVWTCGADDDSGGDVTAVVAGAGLTGGGDTGAVTLNVAGHAGVAGTVGTVTVAEDSIGIDLGSTNTTAFPGNLGQTAFDDRLKWNGGPDGLDVETGRGSLGLGSLATMSTIGTSEITDGAVREVDLAAGNEPVDDYILAFDSASGGFTWRRGTGIETEIDPTVPANVKDGVSWGEVIGIPAGFADGVDHTGIEIESDPNVPPNVKDGFQWHDIIEYGTLPTNGVPSWNGYYFVPGSMFDKGSGKVGIGTSNPQSYLSIGADGQTNTALWARRDNHGQVAIVAENRGDGGVGLWAESDNGWAGLFVGMTGVAGELHVNGRAYSTEGWFLFSDRRWRKNITPIDGALNKILGLNVVMFDWNREEYPDRRFPEGTQIGFIAQEVESVFPEVVSTDADGYRFVSYQTLTPVLVESIKEQQEIIDEQKAELDQQKAELGDLRARMARLEDALRRLDASTAARRHSGDGPNGSEAVTAGR